MKKTAKYILAALAMITFTSCSDPMDEITSLVLGRNLAPVSLEARVVNKTNVRLTWETMEGPTGYVVEVFENDSLSFAGSAIKSIEVKPNTAVLVEGLVGETPYSFRVKAVTAGDPSKDSKWSTAYAKTEAEQIFFDLADDDIQAESVTLRWPAGQAAEKIEVKPDDENLEKVTYQLTAEDIAAGTATINGLLPETKYTAVMKAANGKTRGRTSFTTAIKLEPTDILVREGDDLATAIKEAPEGYRLIIMPGEYPLVSGETTTGANITVDKNLTIKGKELNNKPVILGRFNIKGGASLTVDQVIMDGSTSSGDHTFVFGEEGSYGPLTVRNCEVRNATKGFFYINVAAMVEEIIVDNCLIHHFDCNGSDFFDCRVGAYKRFSLTNSTIYASCDARDMVRMDDKSADFNVSPQIIIDHCTINGVSNNTSKRLLYVRFAGNEITFTNCLVTNTAGMFSNQSTTAQPRFENNGYFAAAGFLPGGNENAKVVDEGGREIDPQYRDANNGDFTIQNDDVKALQMGDPRWY